MTCPGCRANLLDYLSETLEEDEQTAMEQHFAGCPDCRKTLAKLRGDRWNRFWRRFLLWGGLGAAAVLTIVFVWGLTRRPGDHDLLVYGPERLVPGARASLRVLFRRHSNQEPISRAKIRVQLKGGPEGRTYQVTTLKTEAHGSVSGDFLTPDVPEGNYTLIIAAKRGRARDRVECSVELRRAYKLVVSTDKPIYQPGQTVHLRLLAVEALTRRPAAQKSATLEVLDPKGTKVFREELTTSRFGIAAADFQLADEVTLGDYRVCAQVGEGQAVQMVSVRRYSLPKLKTEVRMDRAFYLAGQAVTGRLRSAYFFGEPVKRAEATVRLDALAAKPETLATTQGRTDDQGECPFSLQLPATLPGDGGQNRGECLRLTCTVVDAAGHIETKSSAVPVADSPMLLDIVPEGGHFVQDLESTALVIATHPDGSPARAKIVLTANGTVGRAETDRHGVAEVRVKPDASRFTVRVQAKGEGTDAASVERTFDLTQHPVGLVLTTDRGVYRAGAVVRVDVRSRSRECTLFLDLAKNDQTVLSKSLRVTNGRGTAAIGLPPRLSGVLKLHAYHIGQYGEMIRTTHVVQVLPTDGLNLSVATDRRTYGPGDTARLHLRATRPGGAPAAAALGLSVVDESVLHLAGWSTAREHLRSALADDLLAPLHQIGGPARLHLLGSPDASSARLERALMSVAAAAVPASGDAILAGYLSPRMLRRARQYWQRMRSQGPPGYLREEAQVLEDMPEYAICTNTYPEAADRAAASRRRCWAIVKGGLAVVTATAAVASLVWSVGLCFATVSRLVSHAPPGPSGSMHPDFALSAFGNSMSMEVALPLLSVPLALVLVGSAGLAIVVFASVGIAANHLLRRTFRGVRGHGASFEVWWLIPIAIAALALYAPFGWQYDREEAAVLVLIVANLAAAAQCVHFQFRAARAAASGRTSRTARSLLWVLCSVSLAFLAGVLALYSPVIFGVIEELFGGIRILRFLDGVLPWILTMLVGLTLMLLTAVPLAVVESRLSHPGLRHLSVRGRSIAYPIAAVAVVTLVGLLTPALARAREKARSAVGRSAIKQVAFAMEMAADDGIGFKRRGSSGKAPASRIREHFPETLYWRPQIITDEQGKAEVEIPLADSITRWQMAVSGVAEDGAAGSTVEPLRVRQDFFIEPDVPLSLTQGDEISLPIAVHNYLPEGQTVRLRMECGQQLEMLEDGEQTVELRAGEVTGVTFDVRAVWHGPAEVTVFAQGSHEEDAVRRTVRVEPEGREAVGVHAGVLSSTAAYRIEVPQCAIPDTSSLIVKLYPSVFSETIDGLDGLLQMPYGCFEQTSSVTYPNLLVLQYLERTGQSSPRIEAMARGFIDAGYQRLLTFEVPGGGFDWYGRTPAHVVLTAYGILELTDMSKVRHVDPAVIERARAWLVKQQASDGSWSGSGCSTWHSLDRPLATTAYVAWALAESGDRGAEVQGALDFLEQHQDAMKDPYTVALATNAFVATQAHTHRARAALSRLLALRKRRRGRVHWSSAGQGLLHTRGKWLDVGATALAAYAFTQARREPSTTREALLWLTEQKDGNGTFGSTQSTILALRALLAGSCRPLGRASGDVHVSMDGEPVHTFHVSRKSSDVAQTVSLRLGPAAPHGVHDLQLVGPGQTEFAYQIVAKHREPWPSSESSAEATFAIEVKYDRHELSVGESVRCDLRVRRATTTPAEMVIVEVGLAAGFTPIATDLDGLVKAATIDKYSVSDRQVILYVRRIAPEQPFLASFRLTPRFAVNAQTAATQVYEYYAPDQRAIARPAVLTALPRTSH